MKPWQGRSHISKIGGVHPLSLLPLPPPLPPSIHPTVLSSLCLFSPSSLHFSFPHSVPLYPSSLPLSLSLHSSYSLLSLSRWPHTLKQVRGSRERAVSSPVCLGRARPPNELGAF